MKKSLSSKSISDSKSFISTVRSLRDLQRIFLLRSSACTGYSYNYLNIQGSHDDDNAYVWFLSTFWSDNGELAIICMNWKGGNKGIYSIMNIATLVNSLQYRVYTHLSGLKLLMNSEEIVSHEGRWPEAKIFPIDSIDSGDVSDLTSVCYRYPCMTFTCYSIDVPDLTNVIMTMFSKCILQRD